MKEIIILLLLINFSNGISQVFCDHNLGVLYPTTTWQYETHSQTGYFLFEATLGCQYTFTYCSSTASFASFTGDPYLTISTNPFSGGLAVNDNFSNCGLGSQIQWTAPTTGT